MEHLYRSGVVHIQLRRLINEESKFQIEYSINKIQTLIKEDPENPIDENDGFLQSTEPEKIKFVLATSEVDDHKLQLTFCNVDLSEAMKSKKILLNEQLKLLNTVNNIYSTMIQLEMGGHPDYQLREETLQLSDRAGEIGRILSRVKDNENEEIDILKRLVERQTDQLHLIHQQMVINCKLWLEYLEEYRKLTRLLQLFSNRQVMILIILLTKSTPDNRTKWNFLKKLHFQSDKNFNDDRELQLTIESLRHYLRSLRLFTCDLSVENVKRLYDKHQIPNRSSGELCLKKLSAFLKEILNDGKELFIERTTVNDNQQYLVTLTHKDQPAEPNPLDHDLDMETFSILVNILSHRLPASFQILWCSRATEDDIRLFFIRIQTFYHLTFVIMDIDKMHHRLREILFNEQDILTKSDQPHGEVYYFSRELTSRKGLRPYLVTPQIRNSMVANRKLNELFQSNNLIKPRLCVICGKAGIGKLNKLICANNDDLWLSLGKTHRINTQYKTPQTLSMSINDRLNSTTLINTLLSFDSTENDEEPKVYFNISIHAPFVELNRTFFSLFVCGALTDTDSGLAFSLPNDHQWTFYIEIPHTDKYHRNISDNFNQILSLLSLLNSNSFEEVTENNHKLYIGEQEELVARFLKAYVDRTINRLYVETTAEGYTGLQFAQLNNEEECRRQINDCMTRNAPELQRSKISELSFVKFLYRRNELFQSNNLIKPRLCVICGKAGIGKLNKLICANNDDLWLSLGKTHRINTQYKTPQTLSMSINDRLNSTTLINTLLSFDSTENDEEPKVYFNISIHAPFVELNRTFFSLFVCGALTDTDSGLAFSLPNDHQWTFYIEIPHTDKYHRNISDNFNQILSLLSLLNSNSFEEVTENNHKLYIGEQEELVARFLKAYVDRTINRLYVETTAEGYTGLQFAQLNNEEECRRQINDCMTRNAPELQRSKISELSFVKFLYRRVRFFTDSGFYRFNDSDERLGSRAMEQMIEEAKNLSKMNFQGNDYPRIFLVYDPGFSLYLLHTDWDRVPQNLKEIFKQEDPATRPDFKKKNYFAQCLSWLVDIGYDSFIDVMNETKFILTENFAYKLFHVHERKLTKLPLIIEGHTGVGKTFLLKFYSMLLNAKLTKGSLDGKVSPRIRERMCVWLRKTIFEDPPSPLSSDPHPGILTVTLRKNPNLFNEILKQIKTKLFGTNDQKNEPQIDLPFQDQNEDEDVDNENLIEEDGLFRIRGSMEQLAPPGQAAAEAEPIDGEFLKNFQSTLSNHGYVDGKLLYDNGILRFIWKTIINITHNTDLETCHILNKLLYEHITFHITSFPLMSISPQLGKLLDSNTLKESPLNSIKLFDEYLMHTNTKPLFYRLLLHPGITEEQLEDFMKPICQLANEVPDVELVIFFDEVREHIFGIVISIVTRTPLCIIGAPGQSKTLSFQIVLQNLQGPQLSNTTFCKKLPAIDPFFCLGSKYTRSEDIAYILDRAIKREQHYEQNRMKTRCVVFLDEASLPDEKKMVLKVLHPYLDDCKVAFVAVANKSFDAANANRMICIYRSLPSRTDQHILAYGCLGLKIDNQQHRVNDRLKKIINGLCQGYRRLLSTELIPQIYHDRDFIYMLRQLRFELTTTTDEQATHVDGITPLSLLHALEENFNGISKEKFEELLQIFFKAVKEECPDFRLPNQRRNIPTILHQSMKLDSFRRRLYGRYKLIIDESEDESAVRLLAQSGVLDLDPNKIVVFRMSDFPDDVNNELRSVEILSTIKLCMETGKTILMINTGRIHGSLYDVFNQNFSIMATGDNRKIWSKVAIGPKTIDVIVHEDFQCIVHINRKEFKEIPAPFLSRFQKYSLSIKDFYQIQWAKLSIEEQRLMEKVEQKSQSFIEHVGQQYFYGLSSNTLYSCLLGLIEKNDEEERYYLNIHQQYTQLTVKSKSVIEQNVTNTFQCLLRSVLSRLMQLISPESIILKLPTFKDEVSRWICTNYFENQEHFSLENFLRTLTTPPISSMDILDLQNIDDRPKETLRSATKVMIFTRTSSHITGLNQQTKRELFSSLNEDDLNLFSDKVDILNLVYRIVYIFS
ncbi:unnamed protein product [Rotaria sp. Silwood1]|nr:unnamed protein product [Rotaria sp. Silwood1]